MVILKGRFWINFGFRGVFEARVLGKKEIMPYFGIWRMIWGYWDLNRYCKRSLGERKNFIFEEFNAKVLIL